jgi:hypothetical protein
MQVTYKIPETLYVAQTGAPYCYQETKVSIEQQKRIARLLKDGTLTNKDPNEINKIIDEQLDLAASSGLVERIEDKSASRLSRRADPKPKRNEEYRIPSPSYSTTEAA